MFPVRVAVQGIWHENPFDIAHEPMCRLGARQHGLQLTWYIRPGKTNNIFNGTQRWRLDALDDIGDGFVRGTCARHIRRLWSQSFVIGFIPNNCLQSASDDEDFPELRVFKDELQPVLVATNMALPKSNSYSQRASGRDASCSAL